MNVEAHHRWWKSEGAADLRAILMRDWDPIGVNGVPEAAGEYDGYLGPIVSLLRQGADAQQVAAYLAEVQSDRMDLPVSPERLNGAAERIARWYSTSAPRP